MTRAVDVTERVGQWKTAFDAIREELTPAEMRRILAEMSTVNGIEQLNTTIKAIQAGNADMQALQATFFFFLPSLLLSGFMFPFRGMPEWAQAIGSCLPITHFLRIVRGILLKGNGPPEIWPNIWPLLSFLFVVGGIAMLRYRKTLD